MSVEVRWLLLASAPVLSSCLPIQQDRDCYGGLEVGALYEIQVLEQWSEDSRFVWPPNTGDLYVRPYPRCDGFDGLRAGTSFHLRLSNHGYASGDVCRRYAGIPVDGITGVDFDSTPRRLDGLFGVQVFTPDGIYKLTSWTYLPNPVGARAQSGQPPPIGIVREAHGCVDVFAAEMHRIPEPSDASIDARAMDAGQADQ